jgi:hypothetical protein
VCPADVNIFDFVDYSHRKFWKVFYDVLSKKYAISSRKIQVPESFLSIHGTAPFLYFVKSVYLTFLFLPYSFIYIPGAPLYGPGKDNDYSTLTRHANLHFCIFAFLHSANCWPVFFSANK